MDNGDMDNGQQALILFYALFWATALSVVSRYRAFDSAAIFDSWSLRSTTRWFLAVVFMNGLPALLLLALYGSAVFSGSSKYDVFGAAIASMSAFGFHRILHAIFSSMNQLLYESDEWKEISKGQVQAPLPHLIGGALYIVVPIALGCFMAW